ncbi:MAG: radical SAM family heme chaperone HemW [Vicingaceae bacterium]
MAGIYIHIPFCKQSCSYCDFHFSTSFKYKSDLVNALVKELDQRKNDLSGTINTIYFGGGTPSLLSGDELKLIVEAVYKNYAVANNIELTLECNPDDLSQQKLKELAGSGVNRLSIGIQSFNDDELKFFNRAHNSSEAESSIKRSQDVGFENITMDLIYGSPLLTDSVWLDNLKKVNDFGVPHLSAYGLTVEPKTKLEHQIKTGQFPVLDDDKMIAQFKTLIEKTAEFGLTQYEVSNFGKEGFYSQHNSNYWKGEEYLGIGPSAHSYLKSSPPGRGLRGGSKRIWNVANNMKYIKALTNNQKFFEEEQIDEKTAFNEYVLTRLRTIWGVDVAYISTNFNSELNKHFNKEIAPYLNSAYLKTDKNKITLTQEGIFIADKITSDLFYV